MNTIGFPNMDLYSEHEHGGDESFWPSFTDIMMVIVMTFLLITVAVILNNWELINNLQASVDAERKAMAKAQSALQVVQAKALENETLDERVARLENLLASRSQDLQQLRQQQQQTLSALNTSNEQIATAQSTIQNLQQETTQKATALSSVQQALEQQKQQVLTIQQEKDESIAAAQETRVQLATVNKELFTLQQEKDESIATSKKTQAQLVSVNAELEKTGKELELLRQKDIEGHEKLVSMQGEYDELDKKYQKLLKPARSTKDKHVVRVVLLKKNGRYSYQLSDAGQSVPETLSRRNLDKKLTSLKQKHADDLYVKIIIPESSSVSHSEAWKFTSEILRQYDYYHSTERSTE